MLPGPDLTKSEINCVTYDVFRLQPIKLNLGLLTPDNLTAWFNQLIPNNQLFLIEDILQYQYQTDPKTTVPIFIEALNKSTVHQLTAVVGLEKIGPVAIQSVPYLKKAMEATSDIKLKVKIEQAIRIIEDK
jgi:hypothetical protein